MIVGTCAVIDGDGWRIESPRMLPTSTVPTVSAIVSTFCTFTRRTAGPDYPFRAHLLRTPKIGNSTGTAPPSSARAGIGTDIHSTNICDISLVQRHTLALGSRVRLLFKKPFIPSSVRENGFYAGVIHFWCADDIYWKVRSSITFRERLHHGVNCITVIGILEYFDPILHLFICGLVICRCCIWSHLSRYTKILFEIYVCFRWVLWTFKYILWDINKSFNINQIILNIILEYTNAVSNVVTDFSRVIG